MLRVFQKIVRFANATTAGLEPFTIKSLGEDSKLTRGSFYSTRACDVYESSTKYVVKSQFSDVQLSRLPYADFVFENIGQYGDRVALECGLTGRSYTYELVQLLAQKFGSALVRRGLRKGDVLGLICPNIPEFPIVFLGTTCVGGVVSTVNPTYTAEEIARQLNSSSATFVVTVGPLVDKVREAISLCPLIKEAFVIGDTQDFGGMTPITSLAGESDDMVALNPDIDVDEDIVALPYSSGTTGLPKGVMLTHRNLTTNVLQCSHEDLVERYTAEDSILGILPFFHSYALTVIMTMGLRFGAKIVTLPTFEPDTFLKALHNHKPTTLPLVPPLVNFLASHPEVNVEDLSNARRIICGAAPLSVSVVNELIKRVYPQQLHFQEGYGMTEMSPVSHFCPVGSTRIGTCGLLVPNTEAKIVDLNTGEALGPNCEGELYVRGPQVMKGYLNNIEATEATIDEDNWLRTGDIGNYDEDGYFHVSDRMKELIKVKGLQVAPSELEDLILSHPRVKDVAVIGVPDDMAGELPRAYIVPSDDDLTTQELMEFTSAKVAPHKHLKGGIIFVESIPKTTTGKILRRELKAQFLS